MVKGFLWKDTISHYLVVWALRTFSFQHFVTRVSFTLRIPFLLGGYFYTVWCI